MNGLSTRSARRRGLVTAALVAVFAGCNSLPPEAQQRLRVFDTYVEALAQNYPFFAQKQIDWRGLALAYRSAVVSAKAPSQFYHLLAGLLAELDDPHVSLTVPPKCWRGEHGAATSIVDLPGFRIAAIDRRLYVAAWPEGGEPNVPEHLPAALRDYPQVVRVGGARVTLPLVSTMLRGAPGSIVELQLRWADGTLTRHTLRRPGKGGDGNVPAAAEVVEVEAAEPTRELADVVRLDEHGRFGLLRLDTFDPAEAGVEGDEFVAHLDTLLDDATGRDGLILDLRDNGGGAIRVLSLFLGRFLAAEVELVGDVKPVHYLGGLLTYNEFVTIGIQPRAPRFDKPVVVLTSWRTGSAAEALARLLQREAFAILVGEQTIGAEAFVAAVSAEDGTTLRFGERRALDASGVGYQDEGITPDVAVRLTIDDVRRCGSFPAAMQEWNARVQRAAERQLKILVERATAR